MGTLFCRSGWGKFTCKDCIFSMFVIIPLLFITAIPRLIKRGLKHD